MSARFKSVRAAAAIGPVALGLGFVVLACAPGEEGVGGRRAYIERLGDDTVSVEVYIRTAEGFEGDLLVRSPVTRVAHYKASLDPSGAVERLEIEWRTPAENPDGPPPTEIAISVEGDSATIEVEGGRNPGTSRVAVPPGVIPTVGRTPLSFAVLEQAVAQAAASEGERVPVTLLSPFRGSPTPNTFVRLSADTVSFDFFGSPYLARVDADGRVLGRSGERTTLKLEGELVEEVDFPALASDYAARDARGEGLGVPSPTATVEAMIAGANLKIVYSRPARRGRSVWGGTLVPYGEPWRTGANAATAFTTDEDLSIGGVAVPAGSYTLFSIYTPDSAELIINEQTGQWGTEYNREMDLARVAMTRESLDIPVERFTMAIEATDGGGVLQLSWDTTRFSVPIQVQ